MHAASISLLLAVAMSALWLSRPQLTCGVPAPALGIYPRPQLERSKTRSGRGVAADRCRPVLPESLAASVGEAGDGRPPATQLSAVRARSTAYRRSAPRATHTTSATSCPSSASM